MLGIKKSETVVFASDSYLENLSTDTTEVFVMTQGQYLWVEMLLYALA